MGTQGLAECMSEMEKCVRWGKARLFEQSLSSNPLSCISVTLIAQGRHSRETVILQPHGSPVLVLCHSQGVDQLSD